MSRRVRYWINEKFFYSKTDNFNIIMCKTHSLLLNVTIEYNYSKYYTII